MNSQVEMVIIRQNRIMNDPVITVLNGIMKNVAVTIVVQKIYDQSLISITVNNLAVEVEVVATINNVPNEMSLVLIVKVIHLLKIIARDGDKNPRTIKQVQVRKQCI